MIETKLNGMTPDIAEENVAKLKEIFPDVFCEGKVDFEKLQQVLGNYVEDAKERYNFSWNGKGKSLKLAQSPSTGTLLPCKEESKDWDTTENLYIEGDNLEVLKLLQKSYHNKIKMIYIDPPYNTGHDFVYKDDFKDNLQNYFEITGQTDEDGNKITTNSESNGRYHTDWLNMMYPRLRLARNLLSDDGVIFISIDDNEVANLKKLCDELFGESNFIADIVRNTNSSKNQSLFVSVSHEYCLIYAKSIEVLKIKHGENKWSVPKNNIKEYLQKVKQLKDEGLSNEEITEELKTLTKYPRFIDFTNYWYFDERGLYRKDNIGGVKNGNMQPLLNPITNQYDPVPPGGYRYNSEKLEDMIAKNQIHFHTDGSLPAVKRYLDDYNEQRPKSIMSDDQRPDYSLMEEFNTPFDNPKQLSFIQRIIGILDKDSVILDFFSGSATTAHAVMQLNAEDGGNRKFICVQLPEPCGEDSEAFKAGYKNICEIGKERIRRASDKIKSEIESANVQITLGEDEKKVPDIGFKVFKLNSSNIKRWQPDFDELADYISFMENNFVDNRTELDVVYEIMIKYGLDLTYPVEELSCGDTTLYSIGMGMLIICLANDISTDVAKFISDYKKENEINGMRVVFADGCFGGNDSLKTNIKEILKVAGVEEFITI